MSNRLRSFLSDWMCRQGVHTGNWEDGDADAAGHVHVVEKRCVNCGSWVTTHDLPGQPKDSPEWPPL